MKMKKLRLQSHRLFDRSIQRRKKINQISEEELYPDEMEENEIDGVYKNPKFSKIPLFFCCKFLNVHAAKKVFAWDS